MNNNNNSNKVFGQLGFMDILGIMSFCLGLMNLNENVTQSDAQELEHTFNGKVDNLLEEIHAHLKMQDEKIDAILKKLEVEV